MSDHSCTPIMDDFNPFDSDWGRVIPRSLARVLDRMRHIEEGGEVTISNINRSDFRLIATTSWQHDAYMRIRYYNASQKKLTVLKPSTQYDAAHVELYSAVSDSINRMGLRDDWLGTGATVCCEPTSRNGDAKGGDSGGRPRILCNNQDTNPTVVVECGRSQSVHTMRRKMDLLFSLSEHGVKIVLIVNLDRANRAIEIRHYSEMPTPHCPNIRIPVELQHIQVSRTGELGLTSEDSAKYRVTSGDLRLSFEKLLLRQAEPGEHDVVVDKKKLRFWARRVWRLGEVSGEEEDGLDT